MNKIPVRTVISESVNFVFRKYLSLLGVLWLPILLSLLFSWFVLLPHFQLAGGGSLLTGLALESVHLAFVAAMSVGVTKEVLGRREGPRFVYFSVGAAEVRVFGGYILLAIITMVLGLVLAVLTGFVIAIVSRVSGAGARDPATLARMTAFVMPFVVVGILLPLLYFWIRLSSFLTAVSVMEHRFGLWRSWALTRGNFWRLFAIVMAIWIPLLVVSVIALSLTMGPVFMKIIAAASSGPEAARAAQREMLASAMSSFKYNVLIFLPLAPIFYGLIIAPGAFAYRALVLHATDAAAVFD